MCVHACNICAGPFMLWKPKHLKSIEFPPSGSLQDGFLLYLNIVVSNNVGRRGRAKSLPPGCQTEVPHCVTLHYIHFLIHLITP